MLLRNIKLDMEDTAMGWGGRRVLVYIWDQKGLSVAVTLNED